MPNVYFNDGTTRTMTAMYFHDGTAQRTITEAWYHDGTTARKVWPPGAALSASASPTTLSGSGTTSIITSTGSSTCTPSGGSGSYTYAWTQVSGASMAAVSPTAATTQFRSNAMSPGEARVAVFRCDVNDGITTVGSNTVTVSLDRLP